MKEEDATLIGNAQTQPAGHFPLVIGVDLGGTQIRTAVLQGATLKSRVNLLTGEDPTPDHIMPRIFQAVEQALEAADTTLDEISGIGIAAPGPLDNRTGVVFAPPNLPGWDHVPLKDLFQQRFNVPIFVENDANTAALGEYMFGAGRGSKEMVYMTISTGIGGGIISNGKILEGVSGTAAELGHMTIDWRGERCNCGNIGCLEAITSGTAIGRRANEMIAIGKGEELLAFALAQQKPVEENKPGATPSTIHVNARTVAMAAEAGIPLARDIIARAAEALGVGLVNIIHIFNPELIILGGGVTQMGAILLDPARRIVEQRAMSVPREAVRIVLAELGINVGLVGAGALIYHNS
ncbi:MAG TPA: ROK family protein [Ktedonobacteraceae bacterium]|nr:ROK family protein [Ktedonobacteraceae bacterium]